METGAEIHVVRDRVPAGRPGEIGVQRRIGCAVTRIGVPRASADQGGHHRIAADEFDVDVTPAAVGGDSTFSNVAVDDAGLVATDGQRAAGDIHRGGSAAALRIHLEILDSDCAAVQLHVAGRIGAAAVSSSDDVEDAGDVDGTASDAKVSRAIVRAAKHGGDVHGAAGHDQFAVLVVMQAQREGVSGGNRTVAQGHEALAGRISGQIDVVGDEHTAAHLEVARSPVADPQSRPATAGLVDGQAAACRDDPAGLAIGVGDDDVEGIGAEALVNQRAGVHVDVRVVVGRRRGAGVPVGARAPQTVGAEAIPGDVRRRGRTDQTQQQNP